MLSVICPWHTQAVRRDSAVVLYSRPAAWHRYTAWASTYIIIMIKLYERLIIQAKADTYVRNLLLSAKQSSWCEIKCYVPCVRVTFIRHRRPLQIVISSLGRTAQHTAVEPNWFAKLKQYHKNTLSLVHFTMPHCQDCHCDEDKLPDLCMSTTARYHAQAWCMPVCMYISSEYFFAAGLI